MAWTLTDSGTLTTSAAEQTFGSAKTTNLTYVFEIDASAMVNNDQIEIKIYIKTLTAGTERLAEYVQYADIQGTPSLQFRPYASDISFKVTIKRLAGTDRAYPWKILTQ